MWIHGTRDSTVPHDGSRASDGYHYEAAEAEVKRFAQRLGCNESILQPYEWAQDSLLAPSTAALNCQQCQFPSGDQRQIAYCLWDGGHSYPKGSGFRESAFWGNRLMVDFFLTTSRATHHRICANLLLLPLLRTKPVLFRASFIWKGPGKKGGSVTAQKIDGMALSAPISKAGKFTFRLVPVGSWTL